jgi:DNA-binding XRE family transcriptional regulator
METIGREASARRIRELRRARGLHQHELAALVGVSTQTIRNAEAGRHLPSRTTTVALARALRVPVSDLL